ncbi:hypothetical protein [Plasmodium yoelii yoelii]|uniref:Uncharacterized protein n=1 Tax=Plasmodium yoelii yoelii TaxID=73239 RepID=Q7RG75_PLAYO|nr:hypothetical protein [Plasmodium yoelii yoelii]
MKKANEKNVQNNDIEYRSKADK